MAATEDTVARIRVELAPDDVEIVEVNWNTLTFRDQHDVARCMARLTEFDDSGRQIVTPDFSDQVLATAWVVMRRTRPDIKFSDLYDGLSPSTFRVLDVDAPVLEVDSPEA